jgi:predicted O-linked N-acetylglucosamine transferase (SPINDLY family)
MQRIDIALDPFPFNGHTTTCDALWQGLPVVSLAGGSYASRFGSSALRELGLEDLIVSSTAQYIEIAAQLAADTERLGNLRKSLRGRMVASTLLDAEGFARSVETAYRRMWQRWCAAQNSGALT